MALQRLAAILAVSALCTVNASPCKPHSSAALSSTISLGSTTALQETASSTITADVDSTITETAVSTDTTDILETTITESAVSTDTTDVFETTITETATDTTTIDTTDTVEPTTTADDVTTFFTSAVTTEETTSAEPTTTTAVVQPPVCVESQILVNPNFDDNNDAAPWVLGAGATVSQTNANPRSAPNLIYNTFTQARKTSTISQSFEGVTGFTYRLEYFFSLQTALAGRGFNCMVTPSINSRQLPHSAVLTDSGPFGFRLHQTYFDLESNGPATLALTVECSGSFNMIIIGLDNVALTKVCFRAE